MADKSYLSYAPSLDGLRVSKSTSSGDALKLYATIAALSLAGGASLANIKDKLIKKSDRDNDNEIDNYIKLRHPVVPLLNKQASELDKEAFMGDVLKHVDNVGARQTALELAAALLPGMFLYNKLTDKFGNQRLKKVEEDIAGKEDKLNSLYTNSLSKQASVFEPTDELQACFDEAMVDMNNALEKEAGKFGSLMKMMGTGGKNLLSRAGGGVAKTLGAAGAGLGLAEALPWVLNGKFGHEYWNEAKDQASGAWDLWDVTSPIATFLIAKKILADTDPMKKKEQAVKKMIEDQSVIEEAPALIYNKRDPKPEPIKEDVAKSMSNADDDEVVFEGF